MQCTRIQKKKGKAKIIKEPPVQEDGNLSDISNISKELFGDSDEPLLSYNCSECASSIQLKECYPEEYRKQGEKNLHKMLCKKCFKNANAVLDPVDLAFENDKAKQLAVLPPRPRKGNKIKTVFFNTPM